MVAQPDHKDHGADLSDDAALVEALRRGDEGAFELMVDRYHRPLIRLARAYVDDPAVAEEVVQEAWLGFLQSLPRFAGRSSLKTWLYKILVNCAHASVRRESRVIPFSTLGTGGEGESPLLPDERFHPAGHRWEGHWADPPQAWPEERLLEAEIAHQLEAAIRHLSPHQQAVLSLRDVEGWSSAEVCDVLDITEANQRVLLHRARSTVRHELELYFRQAGEDDR